MSGTSPALQEKKKLGSSGRKVLHPGRLPTRRSCNSQSFLTVFGRLVCRGLWLTNCLAGGLHDGD